MFVFIKYIVLTLGLIFKQSKNQGLKMNKSKTKVMMAND